MRNRRVLVAEERLSLPVLSLIQRACFFQPCEVIFFPCHLVYPALTLWETSVLLPTLPHTMSTEDIAHAGANAEDEDEILCPEGSVPLHRLCERCREFFDTWEPLDWLQNRELREIDEFTDFEKSFATVAQLSQSQGSCHFCMILLSQITNIEQLEPTTNFGLILNYFGDIPISISIDGRKPFYASTWMRIIESGFFPNKQFAKLTA